MVGAVATVVGDDRTEKFMLIAAAVGVVPPGADAPLLPRDLMGTPRTGLAGVLPAIGASGKAQ